jgi:two-component system nitrate/nitrite sensor histidine kinase NarX
MSKIDRRNQSDNGMSTSTRFVKNSHSNGLAGSKGPASVRTSSVSTDATQKSPSPAAAPVGHFKALLEALLGSMMDAADASGGIIRLLSPHGTTLQLISSLGLSAEIQEAEGAVKSECETCCKALHLRGIRSTSLHACHLPQDCRYANSSVRSFMTTTINSSTAARVPIGIVTLFFDDNRDPSEHTYNTTLAFSRMLSTIIEHDKSIRESKRGDLLAERQAIANEIHDSLAQSLVYTRMRTSLLLESIRSGNEVMVTKYAHDVNEALETSQKTVRELITNFRCSMDSTGLLNALRTLTSEFSHRNETTLEYVNSIASLELPLEHELQVYHIVREALANIAAHSGATKARLSVENPGNHYVFTIEDNGSGGCAFKPVEGHYGMMIMRERAQRIGGEIKVESSTGIGTRIQLLFPEPKSDWREGHE